MQQLRNFVSKKDVYWRLFQLLVIWGVIWSNVSWHWTDNVLVATVLGICAASIGTAFVSWLGTLLSSRGQSKHELSSPVALSGKLLDAGDAIGSGQKKLR